MMPPRSLNTYIFMIDQTSAAISDQKADDGPKTYYDLQGRRIDKPQGLCIERSADGSARKIYVDE